MTSPSEPVLDPLLETLRVALMPAPVAPSVDEVHAVRALVARDDIVVPIVTSRPTHHPLRHVVAVAAAVVALVVVAGAVALATGAPLPNRFRSPARALGLPVDSAALARTRAAMSELRDALDEPGDARVASARATLEARLSDLGRDDRAEVETEARALLARADARLRAADVGDPAQLTRPPTSSSVPVPSVPVPGGTVGTPGTGGETGGSHGNAVVPPATTAAPPPSLPTTTVTTEPEDHGSEPGDE